MWQIEVYYVDHCKFIWFLLSVAFTSTNLFSAGAAVCRVSQDYKDRPEESFLCRAGFTWSQPGDDIQKRRVSLFSFKSWAGFHRLQPLGQCGDVLFLLLQFCFSSCCLKLPVKWECFSYTQWNSDVDVTRTALLGALHAYRNVNVSNFLRQLKAHKWIKTNVISIDGCKLKQVETCGEP